MSHYTVAVISNTGTEDEVYELLAPFNECLEVEPYIYRTRAQIIEDGKSCKQRYLDIINNEDTSREKLVEFLTHPGYNFARALLNAETDDQFFEAEVDPDMLHADGNEYSTYNPDSKWDWYEIGGRWSCSLRDFEGEYHNVLKIADWDYNYIDPEDIKDLSRFWEIVVEGAESTEDEKDQYWSLYKPEYYIEKYGNKSNYIKSQLTFGTYAVLTPDGEWLEPGQMGWFGVSSADPHEESEWERNYSNLIDSFDKSYYVTLVDCHI